MGLFRRKSNDPAPDLDTLLLEGQDMIEQTGRAHAEAWGLGSADRWDLDQTTGLLRFTFHDRLAEAPAQVLGTYSPNGETWVWAWANTSLLPDLRRDSEQVRAWGEQNGADVLTTPKLPLGAGQAADVAALAFRISQATGFYRAPAGAAQVFLTFGPVTLTDSNGDQEMFAFSVG